MGDGVGIDDFYCGTAIAEAGHATPFPFHRKKDFPWLHIPVACFSKALLP